MLMDVASTNMQLNIAKETVHFYSHTRMSTKVMMNIFGK